MCLYRKSFPEEETSDIPSPAKMGAIHFFGVGNDGKGGPNRDTVLHTSYDPVHLDLKGGELIKDPLLDGTARSSPE